MKNTYTKEEVLALLVKQANFTANCAYEKINSEYICGGIHDNLLTRISSEILKDYKATVLPEF